MGSILNDLAARHNLTVKGKQAWGTVEGYWFQVELPAYGSNVMKVRTAVSFPGDEAVGRVASGLSEIERTNRELVFSRSGGTILLSMRKPAGASGAQLVDAVLIRLASLFRSAGAEPACFHCGSDRLGGGFSLVDGTAMKLCAQCEAGLQGSVEKGLQEHAALPNNYIKGLLGALAGALLGSLAWILIGYLGYVAALGGVAISFCAVKGYQMMKGKITWQAITLICVVCVAAMIAAQFVTYALIALKFFPGHGIFSAIGGIANMLFSNSDFTVEFIKDMVLGLLFLALGSWRLIVALHSRAKAPAGSFERL